MGISIVKKTAGNVTLTKRVTKVLKEWQLDFNSAMKITSGHAKEHATYERDFLRKVIKSKKLTNCSDVFELSCLTESNINTFNSLTANLDITAMSPEIIDFTDTQKGIEIGIEALIIKEFLDKHFHIEITI